MKQLVISAMFVVLITLLLPLSSSGQDIPEPPPDIAPKIEYIWKNVVESTVKSGRGSFNTFIDILHANASMGTFQVCIRWDSRDESISPTKRDEIEAMLQRHMDQWIDCLAGYDGWPWDKVLLRISGWAGYRDGNFEWTESDNGVPIYIGDTSFENAPQCPQNCGRFFHTDKTYTYPNCPGGAENHYDFSSWHSYNDFGAAGHGGDWGQRTRSTSILNSTNSQLMVISHEMGHGFYMPDFYTVSVPGGNPPMVMGAPPGSDRPTEYDMWLLRRIYSEIKRIPGRLPEIAVSTTSTTPVHQVDRFTAYSRQGQVKVKTANALDHEIQVRVYNLAGKRMISSTIPKGTNGEFSLGGTKSLSRGIYLVRINGIKMNEVHRIDILE